jgi:hypothetical protein
MGNQNRTILDALTDESRFVREGEAGRVTLTRFGWAVAAALGVAIGLISVAFAIWSVQ